MRRAFIATAIFSAALTGPPLAHADTINTQSSWDQTVIDEWMQLIAGSGLSLSPAQPPPGQLWTTAENIALIQNWMQIVTSLGASGSTWLSGINPADAIDLPPATEDSGSSIQIEDSESPVTPEPATSGLLGGGTAILFLYAMNRIRKLRG